MKCEPVREAISAAIDGEVATVAPPRVDAHLAGCESCRQWQEAAHAATRLTRLGLALPDPGLAGRLVSAVESERRRIRVRRYWLRFVAAVVTAGVIQALVTVPMLYAARSRTSGGSRVHSLGLAELAIGAAFFVGALLVLWRERTRGTLEALPRPQDDTASTCADASRSEVA